ncbi:MAG TPA: polymer-forming cytoskeletal protein [Campylobacterales bacterium]|nr:polymer-forming cytoskeletal protein [Campylobacterales bacterium]
MAFFKSSAKEKEVGQVQSPAPEEEKSRVAEVSAPFKSTTVSEGITVRGDIEGNDNVQINGTLIGNLKVNELTIGKRGSVEGSILAKKVIISGALKGSINCVSLDVMQTGSVTDTIHAKTVVVNGEAQGEVLAENSVTITKGGKANVSIMKAKRIVVNGDINGKVVASELLDVGSNGCVQGEISVKNIKTEEGGKVIGTMAPYQEEPVTKQIPPQESDKSSTSAKEEVIDAEISNS